MQKWNPSTHTYDQELKMQKSVPDKIYWELKWYTNKIHKESEFSQVPWLLDKIYKNQNTSTETDNLAFDLLAIDKIKII